MRLINLNTGDLFIMNGKLFIKTNEHGHNYTKAVKLEGYNKGHIICIAPDAKVRRITNGSGSTDNSNNYGTGRWTGHKF